MDLYQQIIHMSRYSRWLPTEGRRELSWEETADRYFDFFWTYKFHSGRGQYILNQDLFDELRSSVKNLEVVPSMRAIMTAGPALARDNVAGFSCSYTAPGIMEGFEGLRGFDEIAYILLCGTGAGFSVEKQYVERLPYLGTYVPIEFYHLSWETAYPKVNLEELSWFDFESNKVVVADSKYGWASAIRTLVSRLYSGQLDVGWDTSKVRPAGAPLKTFGGRASGPEPLEDLFRFIKDIFNKAYNDFQEKLNPLQVHDILCKIAEIVVVGGVRRSALIGLSDLSDKELQKAKFFYPNKPFDDPTQWYNAEPQRKLANNSAVYTSKPSYHQFCEEFKSIEDSRSGERGIFNREAVNAHIERLGLDRSPLNVYGINPCGEINLQPESFCNLSEVVIRADDTPSAIKEKIIKATILGTMQSCLTDFVYLNPTWKHNCEIERLLGVSLTGVQDNYFTAIGGPHLEEKLQQFRGVARDTNKKFAKILGVNESAAITCNKPSGTVSQLVNSSSGIHGRHSKYYMRSIRGDNKDPVTKLMKQSGLYWEAATGKEDSTSVFYFPIESPDGSIFSSEVSAINQLEHWKQYALNWCEHNPSCTIYVRDKEWEIVREWCWENFETLRGLSFMPYDGGIYEQAPYTTIDEDLYKVIKQEYDKIEIDWTQLANIEKEDHTTAMQEYACTAGVCELP